MFRNSSLILKNNFAKNISWPKYMSTVAKALKYDKFGEPMDVLHLAEDCAEDPKGNEVLVKILASPVNPADINTIQGKYPVKPKFPAIGGNECVAEVVCAGDEVKNLKPGQKVILIATGQGAWRTHATFKEEQLLAIDNGVGLAEAATLAVNPCTAYRMLKDFIQLKPGDTIIQNGATSSVARSAFQLCKAWGINAVGVIRKNGNNDQIKEELKSLGATEIFTDEEIRTTKIFKEGKLKAPCLGLNCVGGKSATEVSRHLRDHGILVTYGGMSKEPVTVSTASLIFKDISFLGFWMTRWTKQNSHTPQQREMYDELTKMILEGKLKAAPHQFVPLEQFQEAEPALNMKDFGGKKAIFNMEC